MRGLNCGDVDLARTRLKQAARDLEFEKAAMLRDQIYELRQQLDLEDKRPEWEKLREMA